MAQSRNPELELVPASSSIGAEVLGVDLATLTESIYKKIRIPYVNGEFCFLRNKSHPEDHVRLGRYFGELHTSKTITKVKGYPLIAEVRKEPQQKRISEETGTPTTFLPSPPWVQFWLLANYQKLVVIPCLLMSCAFEKLSRGIRETLRSLDAVHAKNALDPKNLSSDRRLNETELQSIGSAAESLVNTRQLSDTRKQVERFYILTRPIPFDLMDGAKKKVNSAQIFIMRRLSQKSPYRFR